MTTPDRYRRVFDRARNLFAGENAAALRWLLQPKRALGGAIPLQLAHTEDGAREVEAMIDRIEAGVYI